jgi:hypothetical protein
MTIYCVQRITTGAIVYTGDAFGKAGQRLVPGHCYGWGPSKADAIADCDRRRKEFSAKPPERNRGMRTLRGEGGS